MALLFIILISTFHTGVKQG